MKNSVIAVYIYTANPLTQLSVLAWSSHSWPPEEKTSGRWIHLRKLQMKKRRSLTNSLNQVFFSLFNTNKKRFIFQGFSPKKWVMPLISWKQQRAKSEVVTLSLTWPFFSVTWPISAPRFIYFYFFWFTSAASVYHASLNPSERLLSSCEFLQDNWWEHQPDKQYKVIVV